MEKLPNNNNLNNKILLDNNNRVEDFLISQILIILEIKITIKIQDFLILLVLGSHNNSLIVEDLEILEITNNKVSTNLLNNNKDLINLLNNNNNLALINLLNKVSINLLNSKDLINLLNNNNLITFNKIINSNNNLVNLKIY